MKEKHAYDLKYDLKNAMCKMGFAANDQIIEKYIDFLFLLQKWNGAYNLTAIRSFDKMITHHILDSLSVMPFLSGCRFLDVGTGAGFPGMPLAIYYNEKNFHLLDSSGKKIRFLLHVKNTMHIENVFCECVRMEKYRSTLLFDGILCRAVGRISDIIAGTDRLLGPGGKWLFMKGLIPDEELNHMRHLSYPYVIHPLTVPGVEGARHLIVVEK